MPSISVIITTYGGSMKLKRAIRSILNQDFDDFELIVVDDNNPVSSARKTTESYMEEFNNDKRVIYVKHLENRNGAAARNTGIQRAVGKYTCFLDDDDFYLHDRLKNSFFFMEKNTEYVGVCFRTGMVKKSILSGMTKPRDNDISVYEMMTNQNTIGTGSNLFIKTEIIRKIDGFDERFPRFQDVEFMIRVLEEGKVKYLSQLEIIKDVSDVRMISYPNIKKATALFEDKFADLMESFPNPMEVKKDKMSAVFYAAMVNGKREYLEDAIRFCQRQNLIETDIQKNLYWKFKIEKIRNLVKKGVGKPLYGALQYLKNYHKDCAYKKELSLSVYKEIKDIVANG